MSSSQLLASLIELTGADATTAHFFLESSGFDLNAAASAYWEQQQQQTTAPTRSVGGDDNVRAPLPAVEEQLYDSPNTAQHSTAEQSRDRPQHVYLPTNATRHCSLHSHLLPSLPFFLPSFLPLSCCCAACVCVCVCVCVLCCSVPAARGSVYGGFKLGEVHIDPFRSFKAEFNTAAAPALGTGHSVAAHHTTPHHTTHTQQSPAQLSIPPVASLSGSALFASSAQRPPPRLRALKTNSCSLHPSVSQPTSPPARQPINQPASRPSYCSLPVLAPCQLRPPVCLSAAVCAAVLTICRPLLALLVLACMCRVRVLLCCQICCSLAGSMRVCRSLRRVVAGCW